MKSGDGNRQRSTLDCGSLNSVECLETSTPGFEAADEPLDFERLPSCRVLWRFGIYTHGQLAEKSFDELMALRGVGNTKLSVLDRYLKERSETPPIAQASPGQMQSTRAASPDGEETLESILSLALERLKYKNTFVLRHFHNPPLTLQAIANRESITREGVRVRLKGDETRLAPFETVSAVQAAAEELSAEIGPLCSLDDGRLESWRQRLGHERFELLRWLAGYTYQGINLVNLETLEAASTHLDDVTQARWLIHEEELTPQNEISRPKSSAAQDALRSKKWRDIGEGWHVRWDGNIGDKAERVLRLVGQPIGISDLMRHLGQGSERSLRNRISESDILIRIDADFTVALAEWGLEEYEGIATEIIQRIERGGGVASRSAIIEEFTTDFGVKEQSVITYLSTEMFAVTGDEVRFADPAQMRPGDPREVEGALLSDEGWGQIVEVTSDHLQGYSILLDRRVCYPNGIRPNDQLKVEVVGFPGAVASVIWRTTAVGKRVEVGRLSTLLNEASVSVGSRIHLVPFTNGVHLFIGDEAIRNAAQLRDRVPTKGKFEVRKSSLTGKFGKPQRL